MVRLVEDVLVPAEEVKSTDLSAVCDGVGLLGAEVPQGVCRFPLTGVLKSWSSCQETQRLDSLIFGAE